MILSREQDYWSMEESSNRYEIVNHVLESLKDKLCEYFDTLQISVTGVGRETTSTMGKSRGIFFSVVLVLYFSCLIKSSNGGDLSAEKSKLYIVYMGRNPHPTIEATHAAHHLMLSHVFEREIHALESLVYHYKHAFNGFSAMLTKSQADILRQLPEVVSVFESKQLTGQTTRSMSYLGLNPTTGLWPQSNFGADVIIGVIDSGIWPESGMFNDEGISPIPARWNGSCLEGELWDPAVHCNKKIIGAKWFNKAYLAGIAEDGGTIGPEFVESARDMIGHGTHCASTAAGVKVENASVFGLAEGMAVGGAPAARIAVYKVLWGSGSGTGYDADMLAAFDQAIVDGVDILSVSIQPWVNDFEDFNENILAIGSYHAAERGILVSTIAANYGPKAFSAKNLAPWQLTVAASTTDREFLSELELGDGTLVEARAVKNLNFTEESFPIVDAATIPAANATSDQSRFCQEDSLDSNLVRGVIILCEIESLGNATKMEETVYEAGAVGVIIVGPATRFASDSGYPYENLESYFTTPIPALGLASRNEVDAYLSTCTAQPGCRPTGIIRRTKTVLTGEKDPVIAEFSSRGPNSLASDILKPDVTAPGVDILAAWPETETAAILAVTALGPTSRKTKFALVSGTSMACPHVSGIAALVKASHPDWSPAAIKSALMTSAIPLKRGTILDYGAGEVNVFRAADPGLIYDMAPSDYTLFLCTRDYTDAQFQAMTGQPISICSNATSSINYPSLTFSTLRNESSAVRTVTNVGPAYSLYSVSIVQPGPAAVISVSPTTLEFSETGQKLSFEVFVQILSRPMAYESGSPLEHSQGFITWADEGAQHTVSSPVSFWNYTP